MRGRPSTKIIRICPNCGEEVHTTLGRINNTETRKTQRKKSFCNMKCYKEYFNSLLVTRTCPTCNKEFRTYEYGNIYCSKKCVHKAQEKKMPTHCFACGKEMEVTSSVFARVNHNYCSKDCRSQGMKLTQSYGPKKCILIYDGVETEYESCNEAAKAIGVHPSTITLMCNSGNKNRKGYHARRV